MKNSSAHLRITGVLFSCYKDKEIKNLTFSCLLRSWTIHKIAFLSKAVLVFLMFGCLQSFFKYERNSFMSFFASGRAKFAGIELPHLESTSSLNCFCLKYQHAFLITLGELIFAWTNFCGLLFWDFLQISHLKDN